MSDLKTNMFRTLEFPRDSCCQAVNNLKKEISSDSYRINVNRMDLIGCLFCITSIFLQIPEDATISLKSLKLFPQLKYLLP